MKVRATQLAALLCLAASLGGGATAGVTGVPGINDYTINACLSGSTSCTTCTFLSPLTLNFSVSTAPSTFVFYAFTACPCSPDFVFLPKVTCLIPFTSFAASTNQSIDLALGCPLALTAVAVANSAGVATLSATVPTLSTPITLSTQAAVFGLPCGAPSPYVVTQAYTFTIN